MPQVVSATRRNLLACKYLGIRPKRRRYPRKVARSLKMAAEASLPTRSFADSVVRKMSHPSDGGRVVSCNLPAKLLWHVRAGISYTVGLRGLRSGRQNTAGYAFRPVSRVDVVSPGCRFSMGV